MFLLGLVEPVLYFICENYGMQYVSSSISGVIISLVPVASFFVGSIFLRERFRSLQLFWAVVSVAGVYLAVFSSVAAYFLINYSLNYLPVRQAASFTSLTSVISVFAGAVLLHESICGLQMVGVILVLGGVYMVNRYQE